MKTYICFTLALIVAALPLTSRSATVQTGQYTIALHVAFGQVELPAGLPKDIEEQIQVVIASIPQDQLLTWTEVILCIVIVVVVGVILYCLWRCSKMIPESQPPTPPDDPSLASMPHLLLYNMVPAKTCGLQRCTSLESPNWTTICTLTDSIKTVDIPASDRMFFRLEAR